METQPNTEQAEQPIIVEKEPSTILKVIVLIALIALLIVGILLPIKLVPTAVSTISDTISNFFSTVTHTSSVTLGTDTQNIVSGTPFKLSWSGTHETQGTYILSYTCVSGAILETSINQSNEHITCGASYFFSPSTNSIELTPIATTTRPAMISVTLSFLKSGTSPTTLSTIPLTINTQNSQSGLIITTSTSTSTTGTKANSSQTQATSSSTLSSVPAKQPTRSSTSHVSNPNGTPNLSVAIENVGYLDPGTSKFVASHYVNSSERAAVKFRITNNGTKNTGAWGFTATLPSATRPSYTAYNQSNLGPGDSIDYTLGFDSINSAEDNIVTITAALNNESAEANSANNTASAHIFNTGGNYTNNNYPGQYSNITGSDLGVSIVSVGTINSYSNTISPTTSFSTNSQIAVQLKVVNLGSQPSGTWNFSANLPIQGQNSQYVSPYQNSLAPGQSTIMTLTFTNLENEGANVFSVELNPGNGGDVNQNNNQASVTLYAY